jgi:hypothetical protein
MIITIENRGTPEQPRYVIMNSYLWFWDEQKQEFVEKGGTLYSETSAASAAYREIILSEIEGKPVRKFVAPVYLELYTTEEIDQATIEDWCQRATRFIIHSDKAGMGPVNNSVGMLSVAWGHLKELNPEGETCLG